MLAVVGNILAVTDPSTVSTGFNPITLIDYGVLGVVIVAILLGYLWPKPSVERLIEDKQKAEEQRDAANKVLTEQVMPALVEATNIMSSLRPIIEDATFELRQTRTGDGRGRDR